MTDQTNEQITEDEVREQAASVVKELIEKAGLVSGQLLVIGCSSSEIGGHVIGSASSRSLAEAVYEGVSRALSGTGIYLLAQCCEHLNRALVTERAAVSNTERIVNAIPQAKAGGSFATVCYEKFSDPVVIDSVRADAGLDIGGTLIGMHLKHVAVPVRLSLSGIGAAQIIAARVRPPFTGGPRTAYDDTLL